MTHKMNYVQYMEYAIYTDHLSPDRTPSLGALTDLKQDLNEKSMSINVELL